MRASALQRRARALASVCALSCVASLSQAQDLNLPNPLRLPDLSLVTSAEQWRSEQRGRILELFQEHVYGRPTLGKPAGMTFTRFDWDLYMDFFATVQIPNAVPTPAGGAGGAESNAGGAASLGGVASAGGGAPPSSAGIPSAPGSAGSSGVGPGAPEKAALAGDSGAGCGCRLAPQDTHPNKGFGLLFALGAAAAFRRRTASPPRC